MEEATTIAAYNFIIPRREVEHKFKAPKVKKNTRNKKKIVKPLTPNIEPPVIHTTGLAQVLNKYRIFIDEDVQFKEQVGMIAEGMGAIVQHNEDDTGSPSKLSVGIYVVQPKGQEKNKLVSRLASKGIMAVSPVWLFTCYEKNEHVSPIQFPYNVKDGSKVLLSEVSEDVDDNPFGLEHVDYDYLEAHKPGKQLVLDEFFVKEANNETETDSSYRTTEQEEEEYTSNNYGDDEAEEDEAEEDEEELIRKELNYNSGKRISRESSKEREAKRRASEKRRMEILDGAKMFATRSSQRTQKSKEVCSSSPNEHGMDRMKIWYEEQPLPI